ncbi:MAG: hypothetical protein D6689_05005 [Deltaproteobacteria bacterium]|nr:MAG: hypothetical protein D6689_05005 [Deltaproteobacteria bacterium]
MSSVKRIVAPAAIACAFAACADPRSKFDEFGRHVVDAAVEVRVDAAPVDEIPDVTGEFLLSMSPVIAPDIPFQYRATVSLDQSGDIPMLAMTLTPLHRDTREPIDGFDSTYMAEVSRAGQFDASGESTVPGEANGITGAQVDVKLTLHGIIRTEDLFCGDLEGDVVRPTRINLDGSTFAAIRIEPGTTGDALPAPVAGCPSDMPPDAGAPDAGAPDAGAPDAGAPDAGAPDA